MKAARRFVVLGVVVLTACGGGGGGGGDAAGGPTTGFTKTVELPSTEDNWIGPFAATGARYQMLVKAADVGGAGPIRSIAFRRAVAMGAVTCADVTIRLGHTGLNDLTTTFANNVEEGRGSTVAVVDGGSVAIPAGATDEYFTIRFDRTFHYNGADNLVVDVISGACSSSVVLRATEAATPYTTLIWTFDTAAATGATYSSLANMKLAFVAGDDALTYSAAGTVLFGSPFTNDPGGLTKVQTLYLASDIDGRGRVTGIGFPVGAPAVAQTHTVTVRIGHSTLTELGTTFDDNYAGTPVTVASGATFHVPAGLAAGTYVWLPLSDGSFTYNGSDNLVVEVSVTPGGELLSWRGHDPSGGPIVSIYGFSAAATAASTLDWKHDLRLRFAGGTMDVITPSAVTSGRNDAFPFSTSDGKRQFLYLVSELGSPGRITRIACRLGGAGTTATTYADYEVVMAHTTATALGTTFATNLPPGATTVFDGSVSIPGGLDKGDWAEIPLSTPFVYNGTDNLLVQIAGPGGPEANRCAIDDTSTTRYANRRLDGAQAAATGTPTHALLDTRFVLE